MQWCLCTPAAAPSPASPSACSPPAAPAPPPCSRTGAWPTLRAVEAAVAADPLHLQVIPLSNTFLQAMFLTIHHQVLSHHQVLPAHLLKERGWC